MIPRKGGESVKVMQMRSFPLNNGFEEMLLNEFLENIPFEDIIEFNVTTVDQSVTTKRLCTVWYKTEKDPAATES